jgi:hypothetical protein
MRESKTQKADRVNSLKGEESPLSRLARMINVVNFLMCPFP